MYGLGCFVIVIVLQCITTHAQFPPRLNIPGALLLQPSRPGQRPQRLHHPLSEASPIPIRLRKPVANPLPISIPIREESEEVNDRPSILDEEVARLSISALQSIRTSESESEPPRPVQFRPERPVPVLRQDLRESPLPRPVIRHDLEEENIPVIRQPPQSVRQPSQVRQHAAPPQPIRQQKVRVQSNPRPQSQYIEDDDGRRIKNRKPPVQILRKYRTDNDDGSITWGYENEDGTFKEETIRTDCIITGKYGYIDPEGTRREYSYEAGNKCDQPEEEYPPEEIQPQQVVSQNRPFKKQYIKV